MPFDAHLRVLINSGDLRCGETGSTSFTSFRWIFLLGTFAVYFTLHREVVLGSWCVWFCFPLYFLVLRLFSGFQHIYGQWVPGVLVLRTVFRICFLVLRLGFRFWFRGFSISTISAFLDFVLRTVFRFIFCLYGFGFVVSACHGYVGFGFDFSILILF